jgi:Secretion system C-terminal sorting domain
MTKNSHCTNGLYRLTFVSAIFSYFLKTQLYFFIFFTPLSIFYYMKKNLTPAFFTKYMTTAFFVFLLLLAATPLLAQSQPFNPTLLPKTVSVQGDIRTMVKQGNTLYVGGAFQGVGFHTGGGVKLRNGGTVPENQFPIFEEGALQCIIDDGTGGWYAAGNFKTRVPAAVTAALGRKFNNGLVHIKSDMTIDPLFNADIAYSDGAMEVKHLILEGTTLYVAGRFDTLRMGTVTTVRYNLASINTASRAVNTWNPNINGVVNKMLINNTKMYIGGQFQTVGSLVRSNFAELTKATGVCTSFAPVFDGDVLELLKNGTTLYVGGLFTDINGAIRNGFASFNTANNQILPLDLALNGSVSTMNLVNNTLYMCGGFNTVGDSTRISGFAAINLTNNSLTNLNIETAGTGGIDHFSILNNKIYFSGNFTEIEGVTRNGLAAVSLTTGALDAWTESTENPFGYSSVTTLGTNLFIGGEFKYWKYKAIESLFAMDLTTKEVIDFDVHLRKLPRFPLSPNSLSIVNKILIDGNLLYLGGSFDSIQGLDRRNLASVNLLTRQPTAFIPQIFESSVVQMELHQNAIYTIMADPQAQAPGTDLFIWSKNNGQNLSINLHTDFDEDKLKIVGDDLYLTGLTQNFNHFEENLIIYSLPTRVIKYLGGIKCYNDSPIASFGDNIYLNRYIEDSTGNTIKPNIVGYNRSTKKAIDFKMQIDGNPPVITALEVFQDLLFVQGYFDSVNLQKAHQFGVVDIRSGVRAPWQPQLNAYDFAFDLVKTTYMSDNVLAIAGKFNTVEGKLYDGLVFYDVSYTGASANIPFERPAIDLITPNKVGNKGVGTFDIVGRGFVPGTTIKLTKTGQADRIMADTTVLLSSNSNITVRHDFTNVTIGQWNVVVTIPNDTVMTVVNGFTVEQADKPKLWLELSGQDGRVNRWVPIVVNYGNTGNVAVQSLPLWIIVKDTSAQFRLGTDIYMPGLSISQDSIDALNLPKALNIDTLGGSPYLGKMFMLVVYEIPAYSSGQIILYCKQSTIGSLAVECFFTQPLFDSTLVLSKSLTQDPNNSGIAVVESESCMMKYIKQAVGLAVGLSPLGACAKSVFKNGCSLYSIYSGNQGGFSGLSYRNVGDIALSITDVALSCSPAGSAYAGLKKGYEIAKGVAELHDVFLGDGKIDPCKIPTSLKDILTLLWKISSDPNDKIGPGGNNFGHYVRGDIDFPYIINFENKPVATAPAQEVYIKDTLDISKFNFNTFEFGTMFWGNNYRLEIPKGLKNYKGYVDMRPTQNIIVEASANFNTQTGIISWQFLALDPQTMQLTNDVDAGFLPPNTEAVSPGGQGGVTYNVRLLNSVTNNAIVKNRASIVFDANAPIITPIWTNRVDNIAPSSQVLVLPANQGNNTFNVNWNGTDNLSQIRTYDIYYSINGGSFTPWLRQTSNTSATFTGAPTNTYCFFSVAVDSAGNYEAHPTTPDACTTIPVATENVGTIADGLHIFPNPANAVLFIEGEIENDRYECKLINAVGSVVKTQTITVHEGSIYTNIPIQDLPQGLYLLQISNAKGSQTIKVERL